MNLDITFEESKQSFNVGFGETQSGSGSQNGTTFIPSVSDDGIISWTNDGNLPNPEPVNIKGKDGIDGKNGKDGYTPQKNVDYFDGKDGQNGKDGADGYSPVKGTDYWTEEDKKQMVADVISALPVYNGEVV